MAIRMIYHLAGVNPESLQREMAEAVTAGLNQTRPREVEFYAPQGQGEFLRHPDNTFGRVQYFPQGNCYVIDQKICLDDLACVETASQKAVRKVVCQVRTVFLSVGVAALALGMWAGVRKTSLVAFTALASAAAAFYAARQADLYEKSLAAPHYLEKQALQIIANERKEIIGSKTSIKTLLQKAAIGDPASFSARIMHFFTGAEIKAFLEPSIKEGAAGETWALLDDQFINLLKRLYPRHSLRFTHLAAGLEVYQSVAAQIAEIGILPKDNVRQLREQVERFKTIGAGECPYKTVWKNSLQHHTPNQNKVRNNLYVAFAGQLRSFCATPQAVPQLTAIDDECIRRSLIMSLSECVSSAMTSPLKDPLGGFSGRGDAFTGYTQWVRGGLVGFFGQNSSDQVLKAVRAELMRGGGVSLER